MQRLTSTFKTVKLFAGTYQSLRKAQLDLANVTEIKSQWAIDILNRLDVKLKMQNKASTNPAVLFIGNHVSYLDIPLLMASASDISFVAKKEVSFWPLFGEAAKNANTIFVDRNQADSRRSGRDTIKQALLEGARIALFPSGTTCLSEEKPWRKGAFEIAYETQCWVQPFRIRYLPLRPVAYIDDDLFVAHLYRLFGQTNIEAHIEFHAPVKIIDPIRDCKYWQKWTQGLSEFTHQQGGLYDGIG